MIPQTSQNSEWQAQFKDAFTTLSALCAYLETNLDGLPIRNATFPIRVPLSFAQRMRKRDPNCPLLRQVLPLSGNGSFAEDPLQEKRFVNNGIMQKFKNRILLTVTGACAVHCQYCFRQNFAYSEHTATKYITEVVTYLQANPQIDEVILSGGDPLTLKDKPLIALIEALRPHVRLLRMHTRTPVVLPARLTPELRDALSANKVTVVVHSNHANEIVPITQELRSLSDATLTLNQSVLLKGVNDDAQVLKNLSFALHDAGILPYYLHQLDPVAGSESYYLTPEESKSIYETLRQDLPGYLLPKWVQEVPGMPYKVPLSP